MENTPGLSSMHMDALREISNIGMGNAVTSLAQLLDMRINMDVFLATFMPFEETIELVGGYEELVSCVSVQLTGEVPGMVLFIFSAESTFNLIDLLMGLDQGTTNDLDDFSASAVKEVGNVLAGSFITAINSLTNLDIHANVPMLAYDMLGAVLTSLMVASGRTEDQVLVLETKLFHDNSNNNNISGHFFLLTEPGAIGKLFEALGLPQIQSEL
jgi:chemotaxis protein CheC